VTTPATTAADIQRLRHASDWVLRLNDSGDQTAVDEWLEWCRADPVNLATFERMQRLWEALPGARPASASARPPGLGLRRRNRLVALAACVLFLAGAGGWIALRYSEAEVLDTAVGQQRRVTLGDGSQLDIAPDSRVRTHFTLTRRDVQLERGQAFFAVAHGALRPFVVRASDLTVTALGTAFDVRIAPSGTVVTVSQGRVSVAPAGGEAGLGASSAAVPVGAAGGERVTLSRASRRLSVAAVDPRVAGAWRNGTLQFVGEPLDDVVGEVNRYSVRKIVLEPTVGRARFTGTIATSNVADWLAALGQVFAVEVVDQGGAEIHIQPRGHDDAHP